MSETNGKKISRNKINLIIIIAVGVIALIVGTIIFITQKNSNETSKPIAQTVENVEEKQDEKMFVQTKNSRNYYNDDGTCSTYDSEYIWENGKVTWNNSQHGKYEFSFNNRGNMTCRVCLGEDGSKIVCEEDENGNIISEKTYYGDHLACTHKYEYDKKGNKIKCTDYDSDNIKCGEVEFDEKGYVIKQTSFNSDGSIAGWSEYKFDDKGNEVKALHHNEDDTEYLNENIYEYDAKGNMIKEVKYRNGIIGDWYKYSYEYDKNGNMTKEEKVDVDDVFISSTEYEYDANNNLIKKKDVYENTIIGYEGLVTEIYEYEYDEKNNLVKETLYRDGELSSTTYITYDEFGNIIKEEEYDGIGRLSSNFEYEWEETNDVGALKFWESGVPSDGEQFYGCIHYPADYH